MAQRFPTFFGGLKEGILAGMQLHRLKQSQEMERKRLSILEEASKREEERLKLAQKESILKAAREKRNQEWQNFQMGLQQSELLLKMADKIDDPSMRAQYWKSKVKSIKKISPSVGIIIEGLSPYLNKDTLKEWWKIVHNTNEAIKKGNIDQAKDQLFLASAYADKYNIGENGKRILEYLLKDIGDLSEEKKAQRNAKDKLDVVEIKKKIIFKGKSPTEEDNLTLALIKKNNPAAYLEAMEELRKEIDSRIQWKKATRPSLNEMKAAIKAFKSRFFASIELPKEVKENLFYETINGEIKINDAVAYKYLTKEQKQILDFAVSQIPELIKQGMNPYDAGILAFNLLIGRKYGEGETPPTKEDIEKKYGLKPLDVEGAL